MTKNSSHIIYNNFQERLIFYKKKGWIKLLHRGVTQKFAYKRFNLDKKHNSIEQFAERLFYYGEKSKYFWQQKVDREISINDISNKVFEYIFQLFNQITTKEVVNKVTAKYLNRNKNAFAFFSNIRNLDKFKGKVSSYDPEKKKQIRNYYFRIIHQLGETEYKKTSLNISGTSNENIAEHFSNGEIIINFWDFNFNKFPLEKITVPIFKGKPYKNQKEISVFSVIFPHYIYSFKYCGQLYYNPALFKSTEFDNMILHGFDIDQSDFEQDLYTETSFERGVNKIGGEYKEIIK